jgi:hypothetical protein
MVKGLWHGVGVENLGFRRKYWGLGFGVWV